MRGTESTPLSRWVDEVAAVVASLLVAAVGIAVLVRRYHGVISQCFRPTVRPADHPIDPPTDRPIGHPSGQPQDVAQIEAAVPNPPSHQPAPPSEGQAMIEMRDMAPHRVRHIVLQSPIFDNDDVSLFSV